MRFAKLSCLIAAVAASTVGVAQASPELDRRYALQSVGALRSLDNVDGLFADYVAQALRDYFQSQPRFVFQDISRADSLLEKSKISYEKLIEDRQILEKIARATRSETLVRTRILKEGPRYRVTLEWLLSPRMEALATETFYIEEPGHGRTLGAEEIRGTLQSGVDRLVHKVPFLAQVNGRDGQIVTVHAGNGLSLHRGDRLVVGTIDDVKKHPLLGVIAEWKISRTGELEVESIDQGMAFCRVVEEDAQRPIARGQKITLVQPKIEPVQPTKEADSPTPNLDRPEVPRLGWISASPLFGLFSRDYSDSTGTVGKNGGGIHLGARSDANIWLDRHWFADLSLGFSYFPYSQTNIADGSDTGVSGSGTLIRTKLAAAYSYLPGNDLFGAKGWVKFGYQSLNYALPNLADQNLVPTSFSGILIGVGGDLPLRLGWIVHMNLDFGLINSAKQVATSTTTAQSAALVDFSIGATTQLRPRLLFRTNFEFLGQAATYSGGTTISHRAFNLLPSLVVPF